MMNNFSIYKHHPLVSLRVTNESAESADFINTEILGTVGPWESKCNILRLRECMVKANSEGQISQFQKEAVLAVRAGDTSKYLDEISKVGWPRVWVPERESAERTLCFKTETTCNSN